MEMNLPPIAPGTFHREFMQVLLLLTPLLPAAMSQSAQFDPIDFTEQWACKQDGSFLGNFPESFYYHTDNHGYMLSSEPDAWTTFPTKEAKHYLDDHSEPLSKPWPNSSVPFGFHVKPGAYGPENRIIIQLALDDKSPTRPPYNNATETVVQYSEDLVEVELPRYTQRGYGTMWELMKKGVFNCHINRHLSLWDLQFSDNRTVRQLFQRKQRAEERVRELKEKDLCDHGNLKDDCEREMYLINEVPYDFFHLKKEQFACGVQVDYPLCCYASWQNHTDSIAKHMGGEYEWGKGGQCKGRVRVTKDDLLFDKKECDLYVDEGSPKSNNTQISEKVLFHERPECNFVFVRSRKSCLVSESDEGGGGMRPFAYPCVASCYTSIVLQVEIVPLEEAPAEFYLTAVVRRFHRLSQPPRNVAVADDKGEHRFFGYNARLSHHRTDYLGAKVDNGFSDANKTFSTERYVGVWFAWENRTRENKKENIEGKGPFLKIGEEGDATPKMVLDMSTVNWKINDQSDPYGFQHGWKAIEMQRPQIENTFKPYFITINSILNGKAVSYRSVGICPGKIVYKLHGGEEFSTTAIIIASCTLLGFALLVTGLVFYFGKHKPKEIE